jgi:hypothetical protein
MKRRIALAAQLAAVLCLGTFVGTALADNGQKPSDPPGKSGDAPGQEKKADQPAPPPAAPQPAPAQPQPAAPAASEQKGAAAKEKPAKPEKAKPDKPAKPVKPAKTERPATQPATTGTAQSSGHGRSDEAHHHVIICHRTGSDSNPYVVINIPLTAWHGGHTTHPDLNGRSDILLKDPASRPGSKDGFTKDDCESGAAAADDEDGGRNVRSGRDGALRAVGGRRLAAVGRCRRRGPRGGEAARRRSGRKRSAWPDGGEGHVAVHRSSALGRRARGARIDRARPRSAAAPGADDGSLAGHRSEATRGGC